jgi:hypothetical protein
MPGGGVTVRPLPPPFADQAPGTFGVVAVARPSLGGRAYYSTGLAPGSRVSGERKTIESATFLLLLPIRTTRRQTHAPSRARSSR